MRPIILKRDGHKCSIEGYHHDCRMPLVADHRPAKRGHHSTFLDPRNLSCVCSNANYLADKDHFINHAILEAVIKREGEEVIEELRILAKQSKKWSEEECLKWVLECERYFRTNRSGKP